MRTMLKSANRDIVSDSKTRARDENALFDRTYKQLEAMKAGSAKRMAAIDARSARDEAASAKRIASIKMAADRKIAQSRLAESKRSEQFESQSRRAQARIEQTRFNNTLRQTRMQASAYRKSESDMAKARRKAESIGERRTNAVMGGLGRVGGMLRTGATVAAGALGISAGVLVGTSVSKQLDAQKESADLANQAALTNDPRSREQIQKSILGQSQDVSAKSGLDRSAVIAGLRAFQEIAGDLEGAQKSIGRFAEIADASGTDLSDLSRAAGIFSQQLKANGLKGKELEDALDKVLRSGVALSAAGSVEFKDVAKTAGRIAAASGRSGGDPTQAIIDALSINQLAVLGGASGAEESATATQRMTDDLLKKHGKFKKELGVDVFQRDSDGKANGLKPLRALMLEIANKSKGDPTKLVNLFDQRGMKSIEFLAKIQRGDKSGLTGEQSAAAAAFLKGETSSGEIEKGADFRRKQTDRQLNMAFESLYASVGTELVPLITSEFIPALKEATPNIIAASKGLTAMISWLSKNPWEGLGAAVSLAITAQLASAGIGAAVRAALMALLTPGVVGSLAGGAGAAVTTAATAGGATTIAGLSAAGGAVAGGGAMAVAGVAAAGAAAVGGLAAAGYQAYKLSEELDGFSVKDAIASIIQGKFINSKENREAIERREQQDRAAPADVSNVSNAMAAVDAQIQAAQKTAAAAEALSNAAGLLGKNGNGGGGRGGRSTPTPMARLNL